VTGASSGLAATARRLTKAGASVALLALVALVPLLGAAQARTPKDLIAALPVKWNEQTPPFKMIGNVYYVGTDHVVWFPPGLKHWHVIYIADDGDDTHRYSGIVERQERRLDGKGQRRTIPAKLIVAEKPQCRATRTFSPEAFALSGVRKRR
jgi:hypothetical protein